MSYRDILAAPGCGSIVSDPEPWCWRRTGGPGLYCKRPVVDPELGAVCPLYLRPAGRQRCDPSVAKGRGMNCEHADHFDCGDCYEGRHDCPSCGGTGDRPAVTDEEDDVRLPHGQEGMVRYRIVDDENGYRVLLEGVNGAWQGLGCAPEAFALDPAVTDAEVEAATLWLLRNIDMLEPDPRDVDTEAIREQVRGALEAAAATRQEAE